MPAAVVETKLTLHASCVCWHGRGILLEGEPGAGKSELALCVIDAGGRLVADDVVEVARRQDGLYARALRLPGHLEVRGQGVYVVASMPTTELHLAVRLSNRPPERLPEPSSRPLLGMELSQLTLGPERHAALARIRVALFGTRVA